MKLSNCEDKETVGSSYLYVKKLLSLFMVVDRFADSVTFLSC